MDAAVYAGPGAPLSVERVPRPDPIEGEVLVKDAYCGICGYDEHAVHDADFGHSPGLVLGHEFAGTIVDSRVVGWALGTRVVAFPIVECKACRPAGTCIRGLGMSCPKSRIVGLNDGHPGGFAGHVALRPQNLVQLPDGIGLRAAALTEPLAVAARTLREAGDLTGRHATIVGGGPIGLALTALASDAGAVVSVLEPDARRRASAPSLGARIALDPLVTDPATLRREVITAAGLPVACVFDCAGGAILEFG